MSFQGHFWSFSMLFQHIFIDKNRIIRVRAQNVRQLLKIFSLRTQWCSCFWLQGHLKVIKCHFKVILGHFWSYWLMSQLKRTWPYIYIYIYMVMSVLRKIWTVTVWFDPPHAPHNFKVPVIMFGVLHIDYFRQVSNNLGWDSQIYARNWTSNFM